MIVLDVALFLAGCIGIALAVGWIVGICEDALDG